MRALAWLMAIALLSAAGHAQEQRPVSLVPGLPVKAVDPPKAPAKTQTPSPPQDANASTLKPMDLPGSVLPVAPAAAVAPPASAPLNNAEAAAALRGMVEAAKKDLVQPIKPPPHDITVKSGITEIIPISIGRVNRIITPFPDPVIRANRPKEEISRTGNILTIATSSSEDVSLFAWDRSDPQTAISIQLLPRDIPPVEVKLSIAGWEPVHPGVPADGPTEHWETDQPYVESIKALFRDLAQGRVPAGYGMEELRAGGRAEMPACRWPGVTVRVAQRLEGHVMVALVARAVNTGLNAVELDESACAAPHVMAVAAWPRSRLEPGEDTEVYVAVRREAAAGRESDRPSLLRHKDS